MFRFVSLSAVSITAALLAASAPALAQSAPAPDSASEPAANGAAARQAPAPPPPEAEADAEAGQPVGDAKAGQAYGYAVIVKKESSDPRADKATALRKTADYLARTRRVRGALVRYKRAQEFYKLAGDPRADEVAQRMAALSGSSGVLRVDAEAVSPLGYLEVAANGLVVSRRDLRRGLTVVAGPIEVTARRPGCASWSSKVEVAAGKAVVVKVPALACGDAR